MSSSPGFSIVEYYPEHQRYKCGYCKSLFANCSYGMWAHSLTVRDYQNLLDRGWRRSGCYCYKNTMNQTCCPTYTIKCDAVNVILNKSHRKILKKMRNFLRNKVKKEDIKKKYHSDMRGVENCVIPDRLKDKETVKIACPKVEIDQNGDSEMHAETSQTETESKKLKPSNSIGASSSTNACTAEKTNQKNSTKPPPDPSSGFTKRKIMRRERKRNKMLAQGMTIDEINAAFEEHRRKNSPKTLEYYLEQLHDISGRLQNKLVRVMSDEFLDTLDLSAELYKKYQEAIHLSTPSECDKKTFINFLVKSPLQAWKPKDGPPKGYGSFHDQYWLDGKLIAVGVLDILPACVSSVYFFYDPAYSFLSLGTFSILREVYLTRQLYKTVPELRYYYMGFYIHSCPKMRYKAKLKPSKLLCPETYVWCDIEKCLPKLDKEKYSRFNEDLDAVDKNGVVDIQQVLVLYRKRAIPYRIYKNVACENDREEVQQYANFVGTQCAQSMALWRMSED